MKRFVEIVFVIAGLPGLLNAQLKQLPQQLTGNTALIITPGTWEGGIFQQFRYGLNDKVEITSGLLILPLMPNAGVKVALGARNGFVFSSEHSVSCPTLFLNTISFKGAGALISAQYSFPFLFSFSNSFIVSRPLRERSVLTANAGITICIRGRKPDYQSTIDLPLFYPRMAHYYEGTSIRSGISFKSGFTKSLFCEESFRMFLITRNSDNFFLENSGNILWAVAKPFRIKGGYILTWGRYPFGNHLQLWPSFDFIFAGGNKRQ